MSNVVKFDKNLPENILTTAIKLTEQHLLDMISVDSYSFAENFNNEVFASEPKEFEKFAENVKKAIGQHYAGNDEAADGYAQVIGMQIMRLVIGELHPIASTEAAAEAVEACSRNPHEDH